MTIIFHIFIFSSPRFHSSHSFGQVNIDSCFSPLSESIEKSTATEDSAAEPACGNCTCPVPDTLPYLLPTYREPQLKHSPQRIETGKPNISFISHTATEMDPIAQQSSNTLVGGGKVAEDDIPKDGTGS